jgi:hypothetical protein
VNAPLRAIPSSRSVCFVHNGRPFLCSGPADSQPYESAGFFVGQAFSLTIRSTTPAGPYGSTGFRVTSVEKREWEGSGPEFTLFWGGRVWALKVDDSCPGLCLSKGEIPPKLLSLDRLARPKRCDFHAFSAATLVGFERYRSSVRATFAPPSWNGLVVRASWTAVSGDALDFEVQLSASSVGELEGLEVGVVSRLDSAAVEESVQVPIFMEAHDWAVRADNDVCNPSHGSLSHSYFSRTPLRPSLYPAPGGTNERFYVEMVHPDDLARRLSTEPIPKRSATVPGRYIRYGLFGLAIEKGVILRARLRGCWIQTRNPEEVALALYEEFLRQPPPLGP